VPIFIRRNSYKVSSREVDTLSAKNGSRANSLSQRCRRIFTVRRPRFISPLDRGWLRGDEGHSSGRPQAIDVASSAKSRTEPLHRRSLPMSPFGPIRTSRDVRFRAATRGIADITYDREGVHALGQHRLH
jgi:hypothetical protein